MVVGEDGVANEAEGGEPLGTRSKQVRTIMTAGATREMTKRTAVEIFGSRT